MLSSWFISDMTDILQCSLLVHIIPVHASMFKLRLKSIITAKTWLTWLFCVHCMLSRIERVTSLEQLCWNMRLHVVLGAVRVRFIQLVRHCQPQNVMDLTQEKCSYFTIPWFKWKILFELLHLVLLKEIVREPDKIFLSLRGKGE